MVGETVLKSLNDESDVFKQPLDITGTYFAIVSCGYK
jgi:hypothetical protein